MSVLVKGMEMPGNCIVCPFLVMLRGKKLAICLATKTTNIYSLPRDSKLSTCPLVEVPPPHGALIGRSVLDELVGEPFEKFLGRLDLKCPPTIIEAEE